MNSRFFGAGVHLNYSRDVSFRHGKENQNVIARRNDEAISTIASTETASAYGLAVT